MSKFVSILWKIYFWLYIFAIAISILGTTGDSQSGPIDYLDLVLGLPSAAALFGWAWKKSILSKKVWVIYAVVFLAFDFYYNLRQEIGVKFDPIVLVGLAIVLPSYVALILYVSRWETIAASQDQRK